MLEKLTGKLPFVLAALLVLGGCATSLHAQATQQTITGLVTDATGAVIPGATVTAHNIDTGVDRTVQTNATGNYTIFPVPVGNYNIRCSLDGFKTDSVSNQRVETAAQVRINFAMEIGDVTETVEVSAAAVTLNTENAVVGGVIENKRVIELPLNGRNVVQLAVLVPGVQFGSRTGLNDGLGGFPIPGQGYSVSGNGIREIHGVVSLDGVDAKDPRIHITNFVPSIEAIEEFKVQTNAYGAEIGFGGGAVTNITMKSGTNEIHGTLFEFLRNDKLDAEAYFLNFERVGERADKDKLRRNQFGAVVSGPIIKNKTFWAFNYEGRRERVGVVQSALFPHDEWRQGDFSELISPSFTSLPGRNATVVFDAFTGEPFANNVIPQSRLHPGALNLQNLFVPRASFREVDPLLSTAREAVDRPIDTNLWFARADHHFSDADRIFWRMAYDRSSFNQTAINPNFPRFLDSRVWNIASSWVHTFSQNAINDLRFGFNISNDDTTHPRTNDESFDMDSLGVGMVRVAGDGNRMLTPREHGVPDQNGLGFQLREATGGNGFDFMDSYQFGDHLSIIKGSHNLKFGGEVYYVTMERAAANLARGRYTYGSNESGFGYASFLLGLPNRTETAEGLPRTVPRSTRMGYYVQDDWKVSSKLTMNLGFRFDFIGNPFDAEGLWRTINFPGEGGPSVRGANSFTDPATGQTIPTAGPEFVDERGGSALWNQDTRFFMPRLGIAYRPADKWVVRVGAGYFDNIMHQNNWTILNLMPPKSGSNNFDSVTDPAGTFMGDQLRMYRPGQDIITLDDPFLDNTGGEASPKNVNTLHVKPDYKDGDVWKWSLDVQHELAGGVTATVGYVGSKSSHVANSVRNWNAPEPNPDSNIQANRPWPRFFDLSQPEKGVQGLAVVRYLDSYQNAFHHGLQLKLDKRYSNGLAFGISHTYSKSHGDGEAGGNEGAQFQAPRTTRADARGRFRFDQRHNFVAHFVYEIPGGNIDSPLRHVIGGWQTNGVLSLRSGFPFTVGGSTGDLNTSDSGVRRDQIGDPHISNPTRKLWFNTQAFQRNTCDIPDRLDLCHIGSAGYNTLDSPGQKNLDFSLYKNFEITETVKLQFRSEFFNAFNTPYFRNPNGVSFSSTSQITPNGSRDGEIRGVRTPARIIQFGLKLFF